MKILKMHVTHRGKNQLPSESFYCVVDEIPELTYEKVGRDYVGSATMADGTVILSEWLKREPFPGAFAGRELTLKMKDGTKTIIKDYWYTQGAWKGHGAFVEVGLETLSHLQDCFCFCSFNINQEALLKMVDDYERRGERYSRSYWDLEKWVRKQYTWHPVRCNGDVLPLFVNERGQYVDKAFELVFPIRTIYRESATKRFVMNVFDFSLLDNGVKRRWEKREEAVLQESLPAPIDWLKIKRGIPLNGDYNGGCV